MLPLSDSSHGLILRVHRREGPPDEIYAAPGMTIGRNVANTVTLAGDMSVDREHARAEVDQEGTLCLCCHDPANTILQNGSKVSKIALEPGQRFKIGDTDFECVLQTRTGKSLRDQSASPSRGCPYCRSESVTPSGFGPCHCPTCGHEVIPILDVSDNGEVQFVPVTYGSFRAASFVARGGMGFVLKGHNETDSAPVAIKLLPAARRDSASQERFQREIDLLTQIHHPNVVRLLGSGSEAGYQYLVMEWIEGETLKDKISQSFAASRTVTFSEALPWFNQICAGLMALHRKGIVHRDLKPSNVLIDGNGNARIVDLGIAKPMSETDRSLTTTGSAPGTFVYMAPEQHIAPVSVDEHADIYALGVTFLELLTGQLPLGAWRPASAVNPTVPTTFGDILTQMMAQRVADRPASLSDLLMRVSVLSPDSPSPTAITYPPADAQPRSDTTVKTNSTPADAWWKPDDELKYGALGFIYLGGFCLAGYYVVNQTVSTLLAVIALVVVRRVIPWATPNPFQRPTTKVVGISLALMGLVVWPAQVWNLLLTVLSAQMLFIAYQISAGAWREWQKRLANFKTEDLKSGLGKLPGIAGKILAMFVVGIGINYFSDGTWRFDGRRFREVRKPSTNPIYTPDPKFKTGPLPLPPKVINGTSGNSEPKYVTSRDGGVLVKIPAGWQSETSGTSTIILRKPELVATIRVSYLTRTVALDLKTAAQRAASAGDYLELEFAPLTKLESTPNSLPAIQQRMDYQNSNVERVTINTTVETPKNFVIVSGNCPKSEWAVLSNTYDLVLKEVRGQSATRP